MWVNIYQITKNKIHITFYLISKNQNSFLYFITVFIDSKYCMFFKLIVICDVNSPLYDGTLLTCQWRLFILTSD